MMVMDRLGIWSLRRLVVGIWGQMVGVYSAVG